jgi:hypothetical protein
MQAFRAALARIRTSFNCSSVKGIMAVFTFAASLAIVACSFFGPSEATRHESGRTVYRAAEGTPVDVPDVTPVREKVPGETH